ncbi:MAG: ATP-binding cassette domain-containing protein [Chiayiivirga sp.]|jgi:ABC-2 type transport system ATP-binding protein|nr:ATP-binding cassette domain-containing protein [Chiayiivirga sp.]
MGLVGVNGAGKSTLLRLLMGLIKRGSRRGGGASASACPQAQVTVKRDIGYASDDMRLYRGQTLRWHMDFVRSIYPEWDESYAAELCSSASISGRSRRSRGFSHGQRVKALLLLIFARHPRLAVAG